MVLTDWKVVVSGIHRFNQDYDSLHMCMEVWLKWWKSGSRLVYAGWRLWVMANIISTTDNYYYDYFWISLVCPVIVSWMLLVTISMTDDFY